jgi:hypothetical protein
VNVSGPFNNVKTTQTHSGVVFGSFGKTWTLKGSFLCTYLHTLACRLNLIKGSKIVVDHCQSYYKLNIREHEFGKDSVWRQLTPKNRENGSTVERMSFMVLFDTKHNNPGLDKVKEAIEF